MKHKKLWWIAAAILLTASALAQSNPEVTVYGKAAQVKTELIRAMSRRGFAIANESAHRLTFTRDQAVQPNVISEVLFGNYNTRAYRVSVQFMLTEDERETVVSAAAEAIYQDGWGRQSRVDLAQDVQGRGQLNELLKGVRVKLNPESAGIESFAPELKRGNGTLHILMLGAKGQEKISASYSPAAPARIISFADENDLLGWLERNTESTAEMRQQWMKEFKVSKHLEISGLGWSGEKLREMGLQGERTAAGSQ